MADGLSGFRERIDACDAQIIRLINDRLKICLEVGEYKRARSIGVKDEARESEVIAKVLDGNQGPCPPECPEADLPHPDRHRRSPRGGIVLYWRRTMSFSFLVAWIRLAPEESGPTPEDRRFEVQCYRALPQGNAPVRKHFERILKYW